jgi:hypothetical protein
MKVYLLIALLLAVIACTSALSLIKKPDWTSTGPYNPIPPQWDVLFSDEEQQVAKAAVVKHRGLKLKKAMNNLEKALKQFKSVVNKKSSKKSKKGEQATLSDIIQNYYALRDAINTSWSVGGNGVTGRVSSGGFSGSGTVGAGGNWNANAGYNNGNGFNAGASVSRGGDWNANVGYNKGGFNAGASVSRGGNYNVGASYRVRF